MAGEDRIAEYDPSQVDQHSRFNKIKDNQYYKKLQSEIAQKREETTVKGVDTKDEAVLVNTNRAKQPPGAKPKFKWGKDETGDYFIKPQEKRNLGKAAPVEHARDRIVNFLGYKIDMGSKVADLSVKYQKFFIEAKSHNFLMAKYAEIKFGMIQFVLSLMGVSTDELRIMQKKALKAAIEDNEMLFEQNEYNFELISAFTSSQKDKARQKILKETRSQLMKQMDLLTGINYYTSEKVNEIKEDQVKKILQELLLEKQTLELIRDYQ
ncbi:MAG: hypothetical protein O3A01_00685 [bacterium]|nr:hypothetical protein [bacterium]